MSPFLDPNDVERLTGYKLASFQLKWCRNNGIPAWLSAQGEVIVPLAAIEGRKMAANEADWKPDLTVFRKA